MKIYRALKDPSLKKVSRSIAIGIFDGIHRGHSVILKKTLKAARALNARSMVVTFDPHPQKILSVKKTSPKILMSLEHRLKFFASMGFSETLVIPFDKHFARVAHDIFLRDILLKKLGMKALSVGHDFRFGRRALGGHRYLKDQSGLLGFKLFFTGALKHAGSIVSSTRVRQLVERGSLNAAEKMLGRKVSLYGTVVPGRGRGKAVGFPTANLDPHHETLPPAGVYAVTGAGPNTGVLKGVVHIGQRPTFADKDKSVEVHFLDFTGDLYGQDIELFFLGRIRAVRRFGSKEELARQILKDVRRAQKMLLSAGV